MQRERSTHQPRRCTRSISRELARSRNTGRRNIHGGRVLAGTRLACVAVLCRDQPAKTRHAKSGGFGKSLPLRESIPHERVNELDRRSSPLFHTPPRDDDESRRGTLAPASSGDRTASARFGQEQDVESNGSWFAIFFRQGWVAKSAEEGRKRSQPRLCV